MTPTHSEELKSFLKEEGFGEHDVILRAAAAQVTDGASTALATAKLLLKERLKRLYASDRWQKMTPAEKDQEEEYVIKQCESHNIQNAGLSVPSALDAYEKAQVGFDLGHASGAHLAMAGSAEVAGAEAGFTRCIYSFWKFLFDPDYYCGAWKWFDPWLEKHDPAMVVIVRSSGRIVGGRFLMSLRLLMLLEPLWDSMTVFMVEYVDYFKTEKDTNELAKEVTTYLEQPFRRAMVRAGALIYCDLLGPLLFQMRFSQKVLPCGEWWRRVVAEVELLTPSCIKGWMLAKVCSLMQAGHSTLQRCLQRRKNLSAVRGKMCCIQSLLLTSRRRHGLGCTK